MNHPIHRPLAASLALLAFVGITGCTSTVSRDINDQGVAKEVIFPKIDRMAKRSATLPRASDLAKLQVGMRKQDLYQTLGVPHHSEVIGAREWDYLFRTQPATAQDDTSYCQFKVIFDKQMVARSMHWLPANCHEGLGKGA